MKNILIFMFIVVFTLAGYSQNSTIDSLKTLIGQTKSDIKRIDLRNRLVVEISQVNLDSATTLGEKVRVEARKLGYKVGEADALRNISSSLLMSGNFAEAKIKLKNAESIIRSLKDSSNLGNIYASYGMMYGMQSQYDSAHIYYEKAIDIALQTGNKEDLGRNYGNLAIGYYMQSNYPQALLYQQKSLKFAEDRNNISSQAYTLLNIGNTYSKMGDSLRAERSLLKAVKLAKKAGAKNVEVYSYINLGNLYNSIGKWDKSYSYAIKAALLAKETGDIPIQAASYSRAAVSLANLKRYEEAKELINKGIELGKAAGQPIIIVQLNDAMGNTLMLQERYKEAIPYYEKNLEIIKGSDEYTEDVGAIYYNLAESYQKIGAYEKALLNFKEYATIRDSIRSRENIKKATEQTMNYEFNKKEEAKRLEQKNKDAITKSRQLALIIGLGLTVVLVFVAYRALRIKQKGNAKLKAQKEEVQKALVKLESTQAQLIQSEKMASLGELTAGIAHEIQNPLNFVNNFSDISNELIVEMKEELAKGNYADAEEIADNIKNNLEKINHHGKRADAIVKGMLQHSRISTAKKEPTDINKLADEYLRLAYHGLRAKDKFFNATLETDFDKSIGKIDIIPQDIGRVILNLITNAFYAVSSQPFKEGTQQTENKNPTVWISTKCISSLEGNQGGISISVKDNGTGMPQNILEKIFQPFFTTKPTGKGTGLGLSLSYDIIKAHGGNISVTSEEGAGSTFTIFLPDNK